MRKTFTEINDADVAALSIDTFWLKKLSITLMPHKVSASRAKFPATA
jgi:hypothetical protein